VWESEDAGSTWFPRTDDQKSMFIGAVCFDPSNPLIAWAGTGEGDAMSRLGVGVLRSADGGTTWNLLGSNRFEQTGFFEIAIDPLQSAHILAATTTGLGSCLLPPGSCLPPPQFVLGVPPFFTYLSNHVNFSHSTCSIVSLPR